MNLSKADFASILRSMRKPAFLFDGRNVLKKLKLDQQGFEYYGIGFYES